MKYYTFHKQHCWLHTDIRTCNPNLSGIFSFQIDSTTNTSIWDKTKTLNLSLMSANSFYHQRHHTWHKTQLSTSKYQVSTLKHKYQHQNTSININLQVSWSHTISKCKYNNYKDTKTVRLELSQPAPDIKRPISSTIQYTSAISRHVLHWYIFLASKLDWLNVDSMVLRAPVV